MNNEITAQVEGLVPKIRNLGLASIKITAEIAQLEANLKEIPLVKEINSEINTLKKKLLENQQQEESLREDAKDKMIYSGIKEIKSLDGTIIALHSSPGSLVIEDGAIIPEEYYRIKKEVDKTSIKKAYNEGIQFDEKIYIQKDYKLIIK